MKFLYVLTQRDFFSCGPRGRVTHACGIVEGLTANYQNVTLITDPNSFKYLPEQNNLISSKRRLWLVYIFLVLISNLQNYDRCIIRWRPVLPFFALFMSRGNRKRKIIYEINDFSGVYSNSIFIRALFYISLYLAARWSRIYVVSRSAKKALNELFPAANVCVVENGISENFISNNRNLVVNYQTEAAFSVIYFGGYRNYYDWEIIKYLNENSGSPYDYTVNLYGFSDKLPGSSLQGNGRYSNTRLMDDIFSKHQKPILILPGNNNVKASMGFPTKLYEYLYIGCPVLCSNIYRELVSQSVDNWYFYNADDLSSATQQFTQLCYDYESKEKSQITNRILAIKNTWRFKVRAIL